MSSNKVVDFIGIGEQKCGTSWIATCLEDHPHIHLPVKEPHFFSKDAEFKKGLDWYKKLFFRKRQNQISGEFSTTYFFNDISRERIKKLSPDSKIILCLRNPLERAISHVKNDIMAGVLPKNCDVISKLLPESEYIQRSLYAKRLEKWLSSFADENLKVCFLEDAKENEVAFIQDIYKFLGVDSAFISSFMGQKINTSAVPKNMLITECMGKISKMLKKAGASELVILLRKIGLINFIRNINSHNNKQLDKSKVPAYINTLFNEDKKRLSQMLNREINF